MGGVDCYASKGTRWEADSASESGDEAAGVGEKRNE